MAGVRAAARHARVRRRGAPVPLARAGSPAHPRATSSRPRTGAVSPAGRSSPGSSASTRQVLDATDVADFATLLQRAATEARRGEPLVRPRARRRLPGHDARRRGDPRRAARVPDLVVAARSRARTSSRSRERAGCRSTGSPSRSHGRRARRARDERIARPNGRTVEAWVAPHTQRGARGDRARAPPAARRARASPWNDLAVVVRRQGAHLGGLLRALDDARVPRAMPERGLSLTAEPATRPVRARAPLARGRRAAHVRSSSSSSWSSDVVGLSPAAARGLLRAARRGQRLDRDALDVDRRAHARRDRGGRGRARDAAREASLFAGMSVQDAFRLLWEDLPCSRRLVEPRGRGRRRAARARHRRDVRERGRRDRRDERATRASRRSSSRSTPASTAPAIRVGARARPTPCRC